VLTHRVLFVSYASQAFSKHRRRRLLVRLAQPDSTTQPQVLQSVPSVASVHTLTAQAHQNAQHARQVCLETQSA